MWRRRGLSRLPMPVVTAERDDERIRVRRPHFGRCVTKSGGRGKFSARKGS